MSSIVTQPVSLNRPTMDIKDLKRGQTGWTHIWAVSKDLMGELWIRSGYSLYKNQSEGINISVKMEHDGNIIIDTSQVSGMEWDSVVRSPVDVKDRQEEYIRVGSILS